MTSRPLASCGLWAHKPACAAAELDQAGDLDTPVIQTVSKLLSNGLQDKLTSTLEIALAASADCLRSGAASAPQQHAGSHESLPNANSNADMAVLLLWQGVF